MNKSRTRSPFRHDVRGSRVTSALTAAAIAALLVLGSGPAYADESPSSAFDAAADAPPPAPESGPADAPADVEPPPADPPAPPADEPADPPADTSTDTPASDAPTEPQSEEAPAATVDDAPSAAAVAATSVQKASVTLTTALAPLVVPCVGGPDEVVGGFEIDGNICAQGNQDWATTGMSVEDGFGDGTTFHGGTSEGDDPAGWTLGGPAPNGKTDIGTAWAYSKAVSGTVYGYFGLTNDSTSGGTSQYDVEYNQADPVGGMPNRTPGDLLFRFSSTGSDPIAFTDAKMWRLQSDPAYGAGCEDITADAGWCTIPIPPMAFAQQVSDDGTFFEGAINIGLFFGNGTCSGDFGSVNIRSVTGNSFYSSTLKDYVTPLSVDTPSTCGKIIITKKDAVTKASIGPSTYTVSPNPDPEQDPGDAYSITDNDSKDQDPAVGVIEISPVTPGVSYTVTETAAPTGYFIDNPLGLGPNPQTVGASETKTFPFEDHKQWEALTATKTATATFAASYDWSILKEVAPTAVGPWSDANDPNNPLVKKAPAGSPNAGNLYYRVTVTEGAETTTDYMVTGSISVTNPNDDPVSADISDSLPGGTCLVEGEATHDVDVPAGGPTVYDYVCDLGDDPNPADITGAKTNTASITWDKSDYPQSQGDIGADGNYEINPTDGYEFTDPTSTEDETVTISDDKTDALDGITYTWGVGGPSHTSDVYSTTNTPTPGSCTDVITNTASVLGDGDDVLDSDPASAQVCTAVPLDISALDTETLTRTYPWSIDKSTSTPEINVDDEGNATGQYNVRVTAGPGVDSAWLITGTVTIENPNDWQGITIQNLPVTYSGGPADACDLTENLPVVVPAGAVGGDAVVLHFTCSFTDQPSYTGDLKALIGWDGVAANTTVDEDESTRGVLETDWVQTLVNDTVTLIDDNATPGDTTDDTEWVLNWEDVFDPENPESDHFVDLPYTIDLPVPPLGTCEEYDNTATLFGDEDAQLDQDSATVEVCNPYTQISVKKVDFETGEPLAGAEFALFQGDTQLGTATSGEDGIAVFENKLTAGTYTVKETKAPEGYSLPLDGEDTVTVTIDHIDDPDSNFVENGVMEPIVFRDPAEGQLALLPKEHMERDPATNEWVPSDGAVDFGEEIRYVVGVHAMGPKLFHDVTVTDYVPGFNPLDTTSTGDGVLEVASAKCSPEFTGCEVTEDLVSGKITWVLSTEGQEPGVVRGDTIGYVEFIVRMPALPDDPAYDENGVYSVILWNQAYLDWKQQVLTVVPDAPSLLRFMAIESELVAQPQLASNEVTDEARALEPAAPGDPCEAVNPPSSCGEPGSVPLPDTGGPSLLLLLLGLGLALGGSGIVVSDRRHRSRS